MSEKKETTFDDIANMEAKKVQSFCLGETEIERLVAWMDELTEENTRLMALLAESSEEFRANRLQHLASQISAYRRIKDAALRALAIAKGQPPSGAMTELAGGGAL
jgi:hypothetical protein